MKTNPTKTGYLTHPIYLRHDNGAGHPESPDRLTAIEKGLTRSGLQSSLERITPASHPDVSRSITEIHRAAYYESLKEIAPQRGTLYLDPDTPFSQGSLAAAEMAVSGVLTAIDQVMAGTLTNAFCAVRPPGHHAESNRAMGFCLFNNVAIGARYVQKRHGLERVFILDWDVHHGNGTQHSFYDDPTVFYFSTHQYPFYPGTGSERERGAGDGEGATLNCPLPSGAGDREMLSIFEKELASAVTAFKPDFILLSAGFDAHRDDPLASLQVTDEGFREMTRIVKSLAQSVCLGWEVSCLDGGYNLAALARSVGVHLEVLSE